MRGWSSAATVLLTVGIGLLGIGIAIGIAIWPAAGDRPVDEPPPSSVTESASTSEGTQCESTGRSMGPLRDSTDTPTEGELATINAPGIPFKTLRAANISKCPGCGYAWSDNGLVVDIGDEIAFAILYSVSGETVAEDMTVHLNANVTGMPTVTVTATLRADNAAAVSDAVSIETEDGSLITGLYHTGCTKWMDGHGHDRELLYSQDAGQIISRDGLFLGDVSPGGASEGGYVVARFCVVGRNGD